METEVLVDVAVVLSTYLASTGGLVQMWHLPAALLRLAGVRVVVVPQSLAEASECEQDSILPLPYGKPTSL